MHVVSVGPSAALPKSGNSTCTCACPSCKSKNLDLGMSSHPWFLIFGDLNGLKAVNDRAGHRAGDRAIRIARVEFEKHLSRFSGAWVRRRYESGDEFVAFVPLPTSAKEQIKALAASICSSIARRRVAGTSLGISLGITGVSRGTSLDRAIARSDRAMYRAKASAPARRGGDTAFAFWQGEVTVVTSSEREDRGGLTLTLTA